MCKYERGLVDPVAEIFDRLDEWRRFPNYQLERRADIIFSLYLAEVLEARLGVPMRSELAPEFPVRIGTIYPHLKTNASKKIDYLALSASGAESVFVELKTDGTSLNEPQDQYLRESQRVGLPALLDGLCAIFRATDAKRKYFALMLHLEEMGLLRIPIALKEIMAGPRLLGATAASAGIVITAPSAKPHIVYVQPNGNGSGIISFKEFADVVVRHSDPASRRFAVSLNEWAEVQAGS
jgi:hypothetical protein